MRIRQILIVSSVKQVSNPSNSTGKSRAVSILTFTTFNQLLYSLPKLMLIQHVPDYPPITTQVII